MNLSRVHVTCLVNQGTHAAPVLEADVRGRKVAVNAQTVQLDDLRAANPELYAAVRAEAADSAVSSLPEWLFDAVLPSNSSTLMSDLYQQVTAPAMASAVQRALNTNVFAFGMHPSTKYRIFFGENNSEQPPQGFLSLPSSPQEILARHGQVGLLLWDFLHRGSRFDNDGGDASGSNVNRADWRVGLSSWLVVDDQVIDVLSDQRAHCGTGTSIKAASTEFDFETIQTDDFVTAWHVLQLAKANRDVICQQLPVSNAHFFLRIAFFRRQHVADSSDPSNATGCSSNSPLGQLSTLHFVDVVNFVNSSDALQDLGGSGGGGLASARATGASRLDLMRVEEEKKQVLSLVDDFIELTSAIHPSSPTSPTDSATRWAHPAGRSPRRSLQNNAKRSKFCQFLFPLLLSNTKSFCVFQANDSRASLRDATKLLHLFGRLRGATCMCKPIPLVSFDQLHFQPFQFREIGAPSSLLPVSWPSTADAGSTDANEDAAANAPVSQVPTMSWLESFTQRKNKILGASLIHLEKEMLTRDADLPISVASMASLPKDETTPVSSPTANSLPRQLLLSTELSNKMQPTSGPAALKSPISNDMPPCSSLPRVESNVAAALASPTDGITNNANAFTAVLRQANLPSSVPMPMPDVTGLDMQTAQRIQTTDAALLRKNYDALLNVLKEQQTLREKAEAHQSEMALDFEEAKTTFEIQIENLKLQNAQLRSKVRHLEAKSRFAQLFELYEQEITRLTKQVAKLQHENVQLEMKVTSGSLQGDVKKRFVALNEEKKQMEDQLAAFRRRERQFLINTKLVHDSTRKVDQLSRELSEKEDALVETRLDSARLDAERRQMQQRTKSLASANEKLQLEKIQSHEELVATKMYLACIEKEQKKAEILDQFVRKHGDRMTTIGNAMRGEDGSADDRQGATSGGKRWQRDAAWRENEEKLHVALKKALPQYVPVLNKMLRLLEEQELTLREYSTRELDFINLLVELVSEQPALSLKKMIQQEMRKLEAAS